MWAKGAGGRKIDISLYANELIHVQMHLTFFIEFTLILNQTYEELFGAELFCI